MKQQKHLSTAIYTVASTCWRIVPHWPNLAPFTALALYSGAHKRSFFLPLIPLAITDLYFGLHATIPFVYGSIVLISLLGRAIKKHSPLTIAGTTLVGSLIFFIITNLGVWLTSGLYPLSAGGLVSTFVFAVPFFKNALLGDLFFSLIFFGCPRFIQTILHQKNVTLLNQK